MRILVVGAGEVGSNIAEALCGEHEVVLVDQDESRLDEVAYSIDVLPVVGDGTSLSTLERADVREADLLIASTDGDETNIVVCTTAAVVTDVFSVARVKKAELLETWQQGQSIFNVDYMVSTDLLAARTIVGVIGLPEARDIDFFAGGAVQIVEFELPEDSPIVGQQIQEADRDPGLTFAAIIREDDIEIPRGHSTLQAGDRLVVIGPRDSVQAFAGEAIAPSNAPIGDIVIVGGSAIGLQTAKLLEERGFSPRIVEHDEVRAKELADELPNTTVLHSDATDVAFLEREHINDADIIVSTLDTDERNLLVSLLAKQLGVERAVAVVDRGDYVSLFETVGVDVAVNPRLLTAEEITRFTRERRTQNVALIGDGEAEVLEIEISADSPLAGHTIQEAIGSLPEEVVVGAITRDGALVPPRGNTELHIGDHIIIFLETDAVETVTSHL